MSRWLSPMMAFCLSFMLITTLAPAVGISFDRQLDFWALWLVTVFILALPLTYLEFALVKRAKTTVLNALLSLTRESDVSMNWRLMGWLSVIFMPFLAGAMLANIGHNTLTLAQLGLSETLLFSGLAVCAAIFSFFPRQILIGLSVLGVIASLVTSHLFGVNLETWHVTPLIFKEWGSATVLALVASGLGLGIYAQTNIQDVKSEEKTSPFVLPLWIAQLFAVIAFGFFAVQSQIPAFTMLVTVLFGGALLLQFAIQQVQQRGLNPMIQYVVAFAPMFIWAWSDALQYLNLTVMLWGLLICLTYAIFAGWKMKISHLRKALNFNSEIVYNLWRIAVRIVLPLSIIMAMVSVLSGLF